MLPTTEQALACVRVCQMLSNAVKSVQRHPLISI
ncbi:DUF6888 family protein [Nostoc sp.]